MRAHSVSRLRAAVRRTAGASFVAVALLACLLLLPGSSWAGSCGSGSLPGSSVMPSLSAAPPVTTWRVLLLIFRETDADYRAQDGTTGHLSATLPQSDIDEMLSTFRDRAMLDVVEWSSNQAAWDVEVQYPAQPIRRLSSLDARNSWPDSSCIDEALARYFIPGYHDAVLVYWRADDGVVNVQPDAWGLAVSGRNSDRSRFAYIAVCKPADGTWPLDGGQVWIHEWLHPVCELYRDLGYRLPLGDADGAGSHGYVWDQPPYKGWGAYYADLMNARVLEDGVYTGISAEAWRRGTFCSARPVIDGLAPSSGRSGTPVAIAGAGFTGATSVRIGTQKAAFTVESNSSITARVPDGASSGKVTVETPAGLATSAATFTVTRPKVPPRIAALSRQSGRRGALVVIIGRGFRSSRGRGYVRFGAARCLRYASWSNTRIKCRVPAKAALGRVYVKVRTAGGTSNGKVFRVRR